MRGWTASLCLWRTWFVTAFSQRQCGPKLPRELDSDPLMFKWYKGQKWKAGSDKTKTTASRTSLHAVSFSFSFFFYFNGTAWEIKSSNNLVTFFASLNMKGSVSYVKFQTFPSNTSTEQGLVILRNQGQGQLTVSRKPILHFENNTLTAFIKRTCSSEASALFPLSNENCICYTFFNSMSN